ncbi:MAG: YqaE/Pmp3 family membrane protein [Anaerolineae bacterium]|nr:YqaE/Pmp3 family membrane protein [Anaerolineae bacterium]
MGLLRAILCIIFPPLAVLDRGCGTVLLVLLLTLAGWVPGTIAALVLNYQAVQAHRIRRAVH